MFAYPIRCFCCEIVTDSYGPLVYSATLPPQCNPKGHPVRSEKRRWADCLPSVVLTFITKGGADLSWICIWPSFGVKMGKESKVGFSPYFQGFPENMTYCKLPPLAAGQ